MVPVASDMFCNEMLAAGLERVLSTIGSASLMKAARTTLSVIPVRLALIQAGTRALPV